jgi:hypothetical protein
MVSVIDPLVIAFAMLTMNAAQGQSRFVLRDDEYATDVRLGCIGISFQRGHAEWRDGK